MVYFPLMFSFAIVSLEWFSAKTAWEWQFLCFFMNFVMTCKMFLLDECFFTDWADKELFFFWVLFLWNVVFIHEVSPQPTLCAKKFATNTTRTVLPVSGIRVFVLFMDSSQSSTFKYFITSINFALSWNMERVFVPFKSLCCWETFLANLTRLFWHN